MKHFIGIAFSILCMFDASSANKHMYGTAILGGDIIFQKKVVDDVNEVPKNYTILFNYITGKVLPVITYFEVDVNVFSEGSVQMVQAVNKMRKFVATISIPYASNVTATLSIHGFNMNSMLEAYSFDKEVTSSKSYTVVYVKNATKSERTFATNSIGIRQPGDQLIYFESRNITNYSRFPSRAFEYAGEDSITYVGFAFNSPTAMAFLNTTFISDKDCSIVAYDMNADHFVANTSIYGYRHGSTPKSYVNLLGRDGTG